MKRSADEERILTVLREDPSSSLAEIASELLRSTTVVQPWLDALVSEGVLDRRRRRPGPAGVVYWIVR